MTYNTLAQFAQTGGLVYFTLLFVGIVAYAWWPRNRARFEDAASLPLSED